MPSRNMDNVYLEIAESIASASYAERRKVGAILVKDKNIIAMGYNGTPAGFDNSCEIAKPVNHPDLGHVDDQLVTKPEVLHAESNAIAKCSRGDVGSEGATLYVTLSPCFECSKMIIQSGIKRVVYKEVYRKTDGLDLLLKAGIEVIQIIGNGK